MLKEAYYMAGRRNIVTSNAAEADAVKNSKLLQTSYALRPKDFARELDRAGFKKEKVSKREIANKLSQDGPYFGKASKRTLKRALTQRYENEKNKSGGNNMNYNNMVKSAYEEIMGIEKEAGDMPQGTVLANKREKALIKADKAQRQLDRLQKSPLSKIGLGGAGSVIATGSKYNQLQRHKNKADQAQSTYNRIYGQAEKAATYYDEAQLVKEAAEYDYAEACAYEEAALAILDELGYLD